MSPTQLLTAVLLVTFAALMVQLRRRSGRAATLRNLAGRTGMHFSRHDRFGLAARVARHFPVPGVADIRVSDLLYRSDPQGHRYVFTADYTRGVLGAKRRERSVVLLVEPRAATAATTTPAADPSIHVAAPDAPLVQQYQSLLDDRASQAGGGHTSGAAQ